MLESVVVLRHANAGKRSQWHDADDSSRPLDPSGVAQALALVEMLRDCSIDEIWTSPTARCRHTVAALAADRRVPVRDADWLGIGVGRPEIASGLATSARRVLLCTHGETVGEVLAVLGVDRTALDAVGAAVGDDGQGLGLDKGAAWCLRFERGRLVSAAKVVQPSADAESTAADGLGIGAGSAA